jgi:hypothetical protein
VLGVDISATATTHRPAFEFRNGLFMDRRWENGSDYDDNVQITMGIDGDVQRLKIGGVIYTPR